MTRQHQGPLGLLELKGHEFVKQGGRFLQPPPAVLLEAGAGQELILTWLPLAG